MAPEVSVKFVVDNAKLDQVLRGPSGPVYQNMMRRAQILQLAAAAQVREGQGDSGPRGHLRASIVKRFVAKPRGKFLMEMWVGSNHPRAMMYHEGTRPHVIAARNPDSPLHFTTSDGIEVFAAFVQHPGTQPNRYLTDNLPLIAH
jgi:hypothetical protein